MKLRWLLLLTHLAPVAVGGIGICAGILFNNHLVVATGMLLILMLSLAAAYWSAQRVLIGMQLLERVIAVGDEGGSRFVGLWEMDELAERLREHAHRWVRASETAREQNRALDLLLKQMNRRGRVENSSREGVAAAHELRQLLNSLRNAADSDLQQVLICAQEIERSTQEIAAGGEDQAEAVNRTTSYVEQMSANIDLVSQNADVAHKAAVTARDAASEAQALVDELIRGMDCIRMHVRASEKKLRALGDRSQEISSIVETIGTISAHTDMLALNASIESVRAGEHGKGFAVVAEEVRKLAEQAAQATREVAGLIESVQMETQESIAVMADEHAQVEEEVRRVHAAGKALERIGNTSSESARKVGEISDSTQHQLRFTQEVVLAMVRIAEVAKRIRSRAEGVCWTTKTLTKLAGKLDSSLSPLNGCAESRRTKAVDYVPQPDPEESGMFMTRGSGPDLARHDDRDLASDEAFAFEK